MTQRTLKFWLGAAAVCAATLSVTGCWNDDNEAAAPVAPTTSNVPDSAGASVAAFFSYLLSLVSDETSEPVGINTFTPPIDDNAEPTRLP